MSYIAWGITMHRIKGKRKLDIFDHRSEKFAARKGDGVTLEAMLAELRAATTTGICGFCGAVLDRLVICGADVLECPKCGWNCGMMVNL